MPFHLSTTNRVIAVTIGAGVAMAQAISTAVGWHAMLSTFERVANAAAALIAGAVAAGFWILIVRTPGAIRRLASPSPVQVRQAIAAACAAGLLPDGYAGNPERDLLVVRIIAFDRKAGLTDEEIRKDLSDLLAADPRAQR